MIKLIKIIKEFILVISITLRLQYNSAFIIKSIVFPAFILIHINLPAQQKTTNHPDIQKITVDSVIQTRQFFGMDINPFAVELAKVTLSFFS